MLIWIGIGVAIALALPIVVVGVLIATIDPNAYKTQIEASVSHALGREFRIRGNLSVSASLSPTLLAENVTLANMPGGSRPEMMRLDQMEVNLQPRALLTGRLVIARLVLLRPEILLETDAQGEGNWRFDRPVNPPANPSATPSPSPAPLPAAAPAEAPRLLLQTLYIRDGRLTWRDGQTGRATTFDVKRISATASTAESPVVLNAEIGLGRQRLNISAQTGPLARLQDAAARTPWGLFVNIETSGAKLTVAGSLTRPMEGRGYSLRVDGAVPDLGNLSWMASTPLPPLHNLTFTGRLLDTGGAYPDISSVTVQTGLTNLDKISPGFTLDTARIEMPRMTEPVVLTAEGTFAAAPLRLNGTIGAPALLMPGAKPGQPFNLDVNLQAGGATFAVRGTVAAPTRWSGLDVAVGARVPDLSVLSPLAGTKLPALRTIAFSGRVTDAPEGFAEAGTPAIAVKSIILTLPQGDLTGDVTMKLAGRPRLQAAVKAGRLDVDALLAVLGVPTSTDALPGSIAGSTGTARLDVTAPPPLPRRSTTLIPDTPLPLGALDSADVDLHATVAELRARGVQYRDVAATMVLKDGKLTFDPLTGELPGGRIDLRLGMESRLSPPPVSLAVHAPGLDLKPLLVAFGMDNIASGKLDVEADLQATGRSPHALAATLGGRLGVALTDGDVDNAVFASSLGEVLRMAKLAGEALETGRTKLRCLAVRLDAAQGVATLSTGVLDSNRLLVNGAGTLHLGDETLALQLRPMLRTGGPSIVVPVKVDGGFRDPKVAMDSAAVPQAAAKSAAQAAAGFAASLLGGGKPPSLGALAAGALGEHGGDACAPALAAARAQPPQIPAARKPAQ
ncbi:AsmA family protein [Limobrevibacterium gyesilva]|nr:AsmA family protein [Limobrevibacterium gyesilva]